MEPRQVVRRQVDVVHGQALGDLEAELRGLDSGGIEQLGDHLDLQADLATKVIDRKPNILEEVPSFPDELRREALSQLVNANPPDLKSRLESPMEKVFEIYIRTTPERLWEAITDPQMRSDYNFGVRIGGA